MILQKDISINVIPTDQAEGKYEYQLIVLGDPCKSLLSNTRFDFGLVNINPDSGEVFLEMYQNCDGVRDADLNDQNTFIVPVTFRN
jgi:hypothetical protein